MKRPFQAIASMGIFAAFLLPAVSGSVVFADACTKEGKKVSDIITCDNNGGNPIMSIIMQITNFLAIGVGIAVVGGIVWGAFLHATTNGDAAQAKQAINIIVNAVIGLLLFMFAWAFINFLVPGGII